MEEKKMSMEDVKITSPEQIPQEDIYEDDDDEEEMEQERIEAKLPSHEEVRMNEDSILDGMMEAARYKQDEALYKDISIQRHGKELFKFTIRPLSEEEVFQCVKAATEYLPNPAGRHLPKIEGDTDAALMRAQKIVMATVDSDKIWNDPKIKRQIGCLRATDVVDEVLMSGEKDWVCDIIDEISGYGGITRQEYAKNL
ncbi:MAG: hypothetical protein VB031_02150 [Eubacteriaceae bacterium]|nr:hypothetical protein [Eubacteriaceae bacterium]